MPFSLYVKRVPSGKGVPCFTVPGNTRCSATQYANHPRNTKHASTENNGMLLGGSGNFVGSASRDKHESSLQKNTRP